MELIPQLSTIVLLYSLSFILMIVANDQDQTPLIQKACLDVGVSTSDVIKTILTGLHANDVTFLVQASQYYTTISYLYVR